MFRWRCCIIRSEFFKLSNHASFRCVKLFTKILAFLLLSCIFSIYILVLNSLFWIFLFGVTAGLTKKMCHILLWPLSILHVPNLKRYIHLEIFSCKTQTRVLKPRSDINEFDTHFYFFIFCTKWVPVPCFFCVTQEEA